MVPDRDNRHPILDAFPFQSNLECPWTRQRIAGFQKRIDKIAGRGSNGKSNVRLIWPADANPAISMRIVNGEPRARYRLWTNEYECKRTDKTTGLEVVEFVKVDITPPRFMFEEFHESDEQGFNPDGENGGEGFYTHLFSIAHHDESCCNGTEAIGGGLCLGLYREPEDRDLAELQRRIQARDAAKYGHRPGERVSMDELEEDLRAHREWQARYNNRLETDYREAAMNSLALHGWRLFDPDTRSRYHIIGGK